MISFLILLLGSVVIPITHDNQWRAQDMEYPWPLPADWQVTYSHGDEAVNGQPPAHDWVWWCLLDEGRREAVCHSTWDVKGGTTCHRDRLHLPWEHPTVWYERHRGRSQVYLWRWADLRAQWPEFAYRAAYSWQYDRMHRIPSGPGCVGAQGCSARAVYYIREADTPLFEHGADWLRDGRDPWFTSALMPVDGPALCRGWALLADWCPYNANRPECAAGSVGEP